MFWFSKIPTGVFEILKARKIACFANMQFLLSFLFLLHACMYSHQVYNSNGGLAPKIGLLLRPSWMVIPMNKLCPVDANVFPHYNVC